MRLAEEGFPDAGPSPLSRGIPAPPPGSPTPTRIIPALAGNTPSPAPHATTGPDHPRSRGEYWPSITTVAIVSGSSPHSRGIREATPPGEAPSGIIPALAGNTGQRRRPRWRGGDHPRSRGEYAIRTVADKLVYGSSPLSRGIPGQPVLRALGRGIIPALAGNTLRDLLRVGLNQDHPRSRGEYSRRPEPSLAGWGSSPLSRGILKCAILKTSRSGIIPALAGNTGIVYWTQPVRADHPRSRGEY